MAVDSEATHNYTDSIADVLIGHTAYIESSDPVTEEKIRLVVTPQGIERIEPESAVVSWVNSADPTNIRESVCRQVHFFSSSETAARWLAKRPQITFYAANDAFYALKKMHLEKYRHLLVR